MLYSSSTQQNRNRKIKKNVVKMKPEFIIVYKILLDLIVLVF